MDSATPSKNNRDCSRGDTISYHFNSNSNSNNKAASLSVAVIGGGVTGLAAAWHLAVVHPPIQQQEEQAVPCNDPARNADDKAKALISHVTLFEAAPRLGGHAWTKKVGTTDVDVGFMVLNQLNYPNLTQWFKALDVATIPSDMSLSISLDQGNGVEWSSCSLRALKGLGPITCWRLLLDVRRFHRDAPKLLALHASDPRRADSITTREYLLQHNYSPAFGAYYLLPMMAALWSASLADVLMFPAVQLIGFLCNHQMLQLFHRPQWQTVQGRSHQYVNKVQQDLLASGNASIYTNAKVLHVRPVKECFGEEEEKEINLSHHHPPPLRRQLQYEVVLEDGRVIGSFDHVIFACHPPTARQILLNSKNPFPLLSINHDSNDIDQLLPTSSSSSSSLPLLSSYNSYVSTVGTLLDQIEYADNILYLHSDPKLMPVRKQAWASWNCLGQSHELSFHIQKPTTTKTSSSSSSLSDAAEAAERSSSSSSSRNNNNNNNNNRLEGPDGRMKAVYVTYWLNKLQSLECDNDQDVFVSLNPHQPPDAALTHQRFIMAHPQFQFKTLWARQELLRLHQQQQQQPQNGQSLIGLKVNNYGLWFCGAWQGFGFHEDGCRSGFEVATTISGRALPWVATSSSSSPQKCVLPPPDLSRLSEPPGFVSKLWHTLTTEWPVRVCRMWVLYFLRQAITSGRLRIQCKGNTDEREWEFGDGSPCGADAKPVTLRIYDPWFFVKVALEYDLGLARSYMAGHFVVAPLDNPSDYHSTLRPPNTKDETTIALGDPIGLTRLFLLLIGNRDQHYAPRKAGQGYWYNNALTNASGLILAKLGSLANFIWYKWRMDNSETGGSLKNIHAHYDLSNDLFKSFLDRETLMYSSAIYDAVAAVPEASPVQNDCKNNNNCNNTRGSNIFGQHLTFRGTLEEAQWRKLDTLLARAQIQPGQTLLDIGFGWGGLSIHAAQKFGCCVTGITLSVEQKALAEERVRQAHLGHLISFEVCDYRTFARRQENQGRFDRVVSCEMIEAVGHGYLGDFFWAVEQVLAKDGVLVMEAITTPEQRYETYVRSTDFINTVIFPGSCCPSLHALVDAAYRNSCLTLEHVDNIGLHYAQTLAEWRRRFNAEEALVKSLGFDNVFLRAWNYYLTYCEAGFFSQTENCLILVFARPGCKALLPLCETVSVTQ